MAKNKEIANGQEKSLQIDSRIEAVRDLIFGENIKQYDSDFEDVYAKIDSLKNDTNKNLNNAIENLENKLSDLETLLENKIQDLTDDVEKRIADLDDEKADRRKLGKALEKIALMLQE